MPDTIMIFGAGFGTRMGELTRTRPKPLVEVAGKPLIDHALATADEAGIPRKVVNTHYLADQMARHLGHRQDTRISYEPTLLETGGGLRFAADLMGEGAVFTLNSDAVWTGSNPLSKLAKAWDAARMDALLMLVPLPQTVGHAGEGSFIPDMSGRLSRGPGQVYTGAQIISMNALNDISDEKFSLNVVWDQLIAKERLFGISHDGNWCDVGHPEGITQAENMLDAYNNV